MTIKIPTMRCLKAAARLSDGMFGRSKFHLIISVSTTTGRTITLRDEVLTRMALLKRIANGGQYYADKFSLSDESHLLHVAKPFAYTVICIGMYGETETVLTATFPFQPVLAHKAEKKLVS